MTVDYNAKANIDSETPDHGTVRPLTAAQQKNHAAWDPWKSLYSNENTGLPPPRLEHTKICIIGAGFGGLLFAVRLLQSGLSREEIILVDSASDFGGTWYWNRYPGLMCDVESYIYMPLLEETGYIPTRKYVPGEELRRHAESIAEHWQLRDRTLFRTTIQSLQWDEDEFKWTARGQRLNSTKTTETFSFHADFVIVATGTLSKPKIPDLPGMSEFRGHIFHTARWDYKYTGGSPEAPNMTHLKDKCVGVIGTGSTGVQVIPQLAKWCKKLYVFQRTPAAVGAQNNHETDITGWRDSIQSSGPGWQRRRCENFHAFISKSADAQGHNEDLVNDGWTRFPSYMAALGGPSNTLPDFLPMIEELDQLKQKVVQQHIRGIVQCATTAESLIPTSRGWCKRPCFHQNYLETYNLPHVELIETKQKGLTGFTPRGLLVGDDDRYELDLIVLATGYELGSLCPAVRAQVTITGCKGASLEEKWAQELATLHGIMTHGFPNLFFPGVSQAGVTANQSYMFDCAAEHIAYIIKTVSPPCMTATATTDSRVRVQPLPEAENEWATKSIRGACAFAATNSCGRGSYTISERYKQTDVTKAARHLPWGEGMASYLKVLEEWRASGTMEGLEIICRKK